MDRSNRPRAAFKNAAGTSGWVTASIQMLFHIEKFVERLRPVNEPSNNLNNILRALLVSHSQDILVDPQPLLTELGRIKCVPSDVFGDPAAWFISFLLENLAVNSVFAGTLYLFEKCQLCGLKYNNQEHENFMYSIHVDCNNSIQEGVDEYSHGELSDEICCNANRLIHQRIISPPEVLILRVEKGDGTSCSDIPFKIDLEVKFGEGLYRLLGALLRPSALAYKVLCSNGNNWLLYSDTNVKKLTAHYLTVSDQNFQRDLSLLFYERLNNPGKASINSPNGSAIKPTVTVSPEKLQNLFEVQDLEEDLEIRQRKWTPTVPDDLTPYLAAADHVSLDIYDPLLTEDDVEGAALPDLDLSKLKTDILQRWLKCRGDPTKGTRAELERRINLRFETKTDHIIDAKIDDFKWYNQKKAKCMEQIPHLRMPFLPLTGWGQFPSVDIPHLFNWGHAHVYLVENAPNWASAMDVDFTEADECDLSQDVAEDVGQTNLARKGLRFLTSDHILEIMDTNDKKGFYFVKARVQASMKTEIYFPTTTIRVISGSIRNCTCTCTLRTMGRCSHVASLLMFITRHAETKGYGAMSCTDRPCAWGQGAVMKDPGRIKNKDYGSESHQRRAFFDPRPTEFQHKSEEQLRMEREQFLFNVQRLYVTEPSKPFYPKVNPKTGEEEEQEQEIEYLFDLHLNFFYDSYDEREEFKKVVVLLCKKFLSSFKETSHRGPFQVPATKGQSKSKIWHIIRALHITASQAKRCYHLTPAGYKGFLRQHLWKIDGFKGTKATKYGLKSEEKALAAYIKWQEEKGRAVKVQTTGTWVNPTCLELACSPDGIVLSKGHPTKLIEIKCPALLKRGDPHKFEEHLTKAQCKRFCLERNKSNKLVLKENHAYWFQIQMQLGIMNLKECDLIVWTPKNMFVQNIKFHEKTWLKLRDYLIHLYHVLLLPEYFLRRTPRDLEPCIINYFETILDEHILNENNPPHPNFHPLQNA